MNLLEIFVENFIKNLLTETAFKPRFFNGSTLMNLDIPDKASVKTNYGTLTSYDIQIEHNIFSDHKRQPADPVIFIVKERGILTREMPDGNDNGGPYKEQKTMSIFKVIMDPSTGMQSFENYKSVHGGTQPPFFLAVLLEPAIRMFLNSLKKMDPEKYGAEELQEFNAVGTGAIVGYTGPLGMDTKSIHKTLWSGDKKKKRKSYSDS